MPREYIRKTKTAYSQYDLETAVYLVKHGHYRIPPVANSTGVPDATIRRHLAKGKDWKGKFVFSQKEENDMKEEINNWPDFRKRQLKQVLGYVYSKALTLKSNIPSNWRTTQKAGVEWWHGFCQRNKLNLSFPALNCTGCKKNIKKQKEDFLCCTKCNSFSCSECVIICQSNALCTLCFAGVLL